MTTQAEFEEVGNSIGRDDCLGLSAPALCFDAHFHARVGDEVAKPIGLNPTR